MTGIEIRQLRAFVAVADELHFGRAAKRLHMAQPPVSQLVRSFESALGVPLLQRTTRTVTVTPIGQQILERARQILRLTDELSEDVERAKRGETGNVRVGFTDLMAVDVVPRLAQLFHSRNPSVELDLMGSYTTFEEVDLLLGGNIDAALVHGPISHPRLRTMLVRNDRLYVVLAESHPLSGRAELDIVDLIDESFILYPEHTGSSIRTAVTGICGAAGFVPRTVREVPESMTIVALAASGVGVAVLPEPLTQFRPSGTVYRPLRGEGQHLAATLAWRRDDDSPTLARLLEVMRDLRPELRKPLAHSSDPSSSSS